MDIGIELSFYPLTEQYLPAIRALIERLHMQPAVRVVTNSLSTQLFGEYELVMSTLTRELQAILPLAPRNVVLMKLVGPLEG